MADDVIQLAVLAEHLVADLLRTTRAAQTTVRVVANDQPGLILRIGKLRATWSGRLNIRGRERQIRLGHYPEIGVGQAISAHTANKQRVAAGLPPVAAKTAPAGLTLDGLLDRWVEDRATKSALDRAKVIRRHFKHLLNVEARFVDDSDLRPVVNRLKRDKSPTARTALAVLGTVYRFAMRNNLATVDPTIVIDAPPRPFAQSRFTLTDLHHIFAAFDQLEPWEQRFLQFVMTSGTRTGEAMGANVGDANIASRRIELPARITKTGLALWVPLTDWTSSIVSAAVAERTGGDLPLFTNRRGKRITNLEKTNIIRFCNRNREHPCEDRSSPRWANLHSLRRTFVTDGCGVLQFPRDIADRQLNHAGSGTQSAVQAAYLIGERWNERRRIGEAWAEAIRTIYKHAGEKPGKPLSDHQLQKAVKHLV